MTLDRKGSARREGERFYAFKVPVVEVISSSQPS
jgi:hypothetical protein